MMLWRICELTRPPRTCSCAAEPCRHARKMCTAVDLSAARYQLYGVAQMVGVQCADDVANPGIRRMNLGRVPPVLHVDSTVLTLLLAALDDPAVLDDEDLVGGPHDRKPVRHDDRRPAGQFLGKCLLHGFFRSRV
jgi:hypothetical protein